MSDKQWDGVDHRKPVKDRWHVKREITIPHIIATIMLGFLLIGGYMDLRDADRDQVSTSNGLAEKIKHNAELQKQRDNGQNKEIKRIYVQIEDAVDLFREEHLFTRESNERENRETRHAVTKLIESMK